MGFDGKVDEVDMPVVEGIYRDVGADIEKLFNASGLSGKYELVGFNLSLDVKLKDNINPSKKKMQKRSASFSQFKESVIALLEIYNLTAQVLQVDESDRQLLEDKLSNGETISDNYNAKDLKTIMDRDSFDIKKDYTGFYLNGRITSNQPVLIVYRCEPATVLVNTTESDKINAQQILVEFF